MNVDEEGSTSYRRALEALRNGVPNRDAVRVLGCSQQEIEHRFRDQLAEVPTAIKEGRQAPGLLIAGDFGSGKSHLLEYLQHLALSSNFVCSRVVLSKETPLYNPAKVYRAAVEAAEAPGLSGEAIKEIALAIRQDSAGYAELYRWASGPDCGLNPLFGATLLLHERLNNDPDMVARITNFWSGDPIKVSDVRQGLRQIGQAANFALRRLPPLAKLARERFAFAVRLMLAAGYCGWVLLIDEVELIARYGLRERSKSYAELAQWLGETAGEGYPGLTAVASITSDYAAEVLRGQKEDWNKVGARLRAKGTDEENALASRAERGMQLILQVEREGPILVPPNDHALETTYRRLKEIHGKAHGWEPPDVSWAERTASRRMRSYIRRWINEWDLKRLYPGTEVRPEEEELRPSYGEDPGLQQPSEPDSSNGHFEVW